MKQLTTLLLFAIFHFQISAQDSLSIIQLDLNFEIFEIEVPILHDLFSKKKTNSRYRYQYNEIEPTTLLAKKLVSNEDVYRFNLGHDEALDSRAFFDDNGYTFWAKPKHYNFPKWNFSTNRGYQKSQNIIFYFPKNGILLGHFFPTENYVRSNLESHFSISDVLIHLNYSYSNEIYFEHRTNPSSLYNSRMDFHFPNSFMEQRFINWNSIRFPISNNPFQNTARMNFNFVVNPFWKTYIKIEAESNFIFLNEERKRFQTFTFGVGVDTSKQTRIFINRTKSIRSNYMSTFFLYNLEPIWTLNIIKQLTHKIFPN